MSAIRLMVRADAHAEHIIAAEDRRKPGDAHRTTNLPSD